MPSPILQLVCRAFDDSRLKDCPDEQLLRRFVTERDATAFEALVRRHGPLVLDVCRGLLPNEADAEDAFQVTFLVLASKAASIRKTRSLASWLHGVGYRVARRARTAFARRRKHEPRTPERTAPAGAEDLTWAEIRTVLHEELNALPDRLRGPLVLCYLEGMTQDDAAAELSLPKGTLKGRLERGRELLRARLVRRGFGPAALLLVSAWPVPGVSAALVDSAVRVAAGPVAATAVVASARVGVLAAEVLKAMSLAPLRAVAWLAVATAFCAGLYAFALPTPADQPKAEERPAAPEVPRTKLVWQEGPSPIPKQNGPVCGVAFAPDGKTLAVAVTKTLLNREVRGEVAVYDRASGKQLAVLAAFHPVAFSPDGQSLAAREGDNVVRVWEVGKWAPQVALKGLSDTVLCLAFSPDGKSLVAGSGNPSRPNAPGMVRLWDLENGAERATHTHPGAVYGIAFADAKTFLSASSGVETVIKSWDGRAGREPVETKGTGRRFLAVAFAPDGKTVATGLDPVGNTSEMDVTVWDRTTGKEVMKPLRHPELTHAMVFSPDGKTLATGSSALVGETERVGVLRLWDVSTGKEVADLRGHKSEVRCLTFDQKGTTLATGGWDGTVKLWELVEPVDDDDELWVKSEDGVLALRLSAFVKTAAPGEPIELVARLRNLSDKPVNVLRPFGVPSVAAFGVEVRGPRGKLTHRADPPIYRVPPEAFARLKPGESVRESLKIDPREFVGFAAPGRYTITFTYAYKGLWDEFAEKGGLTRVWRGTVAGKEVPIEIRDPDDTPWVKSGDGKLALRLTPGAEKVKAGDPIEVTASLKNLTDKPLDVLRPGGDNYRARSSGLDLRGPRGAIRFTGPNPEYELGDAAFVTLGPGEVVSDSISILVAHRTGSDEPGEYRATFAYVAGDGHRATAGRFGVKNLWLGQIRSEPVVVRKVDPPADKPAPKDGPKERVKMVLDPDDERIKAFVAHLERNGVRLVPEKGKPTGKWRVLDTDIPGGSVGVMLCTFDGPATEEQMREAVSHYNWGWHYKNPAARLAMGLGSPLRSGFEKGVPDEAVAVEEKLRTLFFFYQRDLKNPPADLLPNEVVNAGRDPKDERIQAFVAHLAKNGIKLTFAKETGDWEVVEPEHKDGKLVVSIRSFPLAATESQMRWALAGINLAYWVNARAHLAVSHLGLRGGAKGITPEVKALEKKLQRLFYDYHPATFAVHIAAGELDADAKEVHALRAFLKDRGVELRAVDNSSNLIQFLFAVGPDFDKRLCVGVGYMPPGKAEKMKERYRDSGIPHVVRGNLVLFKVGAPNGTDTKEFAAAWEKVEAAFREFQP